MRTLIHDIEKEREAWIKSKQYHIGSGDIAAIVGANDYCTPLELWARKLGKAPRESESDLMWWGQMMERPIAELCARRLGMTIEYGNQLYCHDDMEWAVATPDYFAKGEIAPPDGVSDPILESLRSGQKVIFECKNIGYRGFYKWEIGTPLAPRIQVMWQLGVTGLDRGVVAPLVGGDIEEFVPRWVEFDKNIFAQLVELAEKFMWHLGNDVPPPAKASDARLVEDIIGKLKEQTVELSDDMYPTLTEYLAIKEKQSAADKKSKILKEQADEMKNNLMLKIGASTSALCRSVGGDIVIKQTPVVVKPRQQEGYSYTLVKVKQVKE